MWKRVKQIKCVQIKATRIHFLNLDLCFDFKRELRQYMDSKGRMLSGFNGGKKRHRKKSGIDIQPNRTTNKYL